jgi:hypothetical protein
MKGSRGKKKRGGGDGFDNNGVPPFAPDPPSARYGDTSSFRLSSGRDGDDNGISGDGRCFSLEDSSRMCLLWISPGEVGGCTTGV